jgi:hypothetical protein
VNATSISHLFVYGTLQPGESRSIQLDTRVEKAGAINHCSSLRTAEGITGQDCVATTVRASTIEMRLSGPDKGTVGQSVRFEVDIVNRGDRNTISRYAPQGSLAAWQKAASFVAANVPELHAAIAERCTNRSPFGGRRLPPGVLAELAEAARIEGAVLHVPDRQEARRLLRLAQDAERGRLRRGFPNAEQPPAPGRSRPRDRGRGAAGRRIVPALRAGFRLASPSANTSPGG